MNWHQNTPTPHTRQRLRSPAQHTPAPSETEDRRHRVSVEGRLLSRLDGWREGSVSDFEFLPLVGQLVRWASGDPEAGPIEFYIPPGRAPEWLRYGLQTEQVSGGVVKVACALSHLDYVDENLRHAIVRACQQRPQQTPLAELGDPWLNLTSHGRLGPDATLPTFKSDGQRRLIRALDALDETKEFLIGCLPTGEGKSLAIHRLVVETKSLVLVVVPTVTLAIDQEKEAHGVLEAHDLPAELAYIGGDAGREGIKARIREGSQRLLFTNPESLRSLLPELTEAAREGNLGAVVVDEAHIVDAEGWEFRPAFGLLPSIIKALLALVPDSRRAPKIALLSATLTQATVENLIRLFGWEDRQAVLVGSLRLRPEPAYVQERVKVTEGQTPSKARRLRVLEVIPLLPRPLYLYSTTKVDVEHYRKTLEARGLHRVRHVHGGVDSNGRREVIREIRDQEIDIVSANKAFGLGLNVPDVRCVVHACVPESLDRFSQEVGRGGRDGRSTISWLVWAGEADLALARKQGFRTIAKQAGARRWGAMKASGVQAGSGRLWVRVDSDLKKNEKSRTWNLSTLVLMQASGLLDLVWGQPRPEGFDWEDLCVRVRDATVNDLNWIERTDEIRRAINEADRQGLQRFRQVLDGKLALECALQETYTLLRPDEGAIAPPAVRPNFADREPVLHWQRNPEVRKGRVRVLQVRTTLEAFVREHAVRLSGPLHRYRDWIVETSMDHDLLREVCHALTPEAARLVRFLERDSSEFEAALASRLPGPWLLLWTSPRLSWEDVVRLQESIGDGLVLCGPQVSASHPSRTLEDEMGSAWSTLDNL